jgi:hypothetical protein
MSRHSKKLYKKYFANVKSVSSAIVNKFFKRSKSATVKEFEENEIIKNLKCEYEFHYNLLMVSLNKNQVNLLLEIDEIIAQLDAVSKDMIYKEGFKDGFTLKHIISQANNTSK